MKINFELYLTLIFVFGPITFSLYCFVIFFSKNLIKWKTKWKRNYEKKLAEKEQKQIEKELEAEAIVRPGNTILEYLASKYNIVFCGGLGCGKTLTANMVTKYIVSKKNYENYKNRRQIKFINPQLLKDLEKLDKEQKINVYSEIELEDPVTGYKSFELWDYLTQKKRTIENGIYFVDEIGTKFGKEKTYEQIGKNKTADYTLASESARYARQDANIRFIATEQDAENIWKPIREKGFISVKMLGVNTWLTKKGIFLKRFKNFCLKCLPAWLTINSGEVMAVQFSKSNKLKTFFKLLIPAYFLLPKQYYIKKVKIAKKIKFKYTQFKSNFELNGEYKYLLFTNADIYKYNTRAHKEIYNNKFDENGNRRTSEKEK